LCVMREKYCRYLIWMQFACVQCGRCQPTKKKKTKPHTSLLAQVLNKGRLCVICLAVDNDSKCIIISNNIN
jgi:hypothetical protein